MEDEGHGNTSSDYHSLQLNGSSNSFESTLRIISAIYGPCPSRRLLNGEFATSKRVRAPFERDVSPILRTLLSRRDEIMPGHVEDEDDFIDDVNKQSIGRREASLRKIQSDISRQSCNSFALPSSKNSITILNGVKSMNALFGDPCLGTKKCLTIRYVYYDPEEINEQHQYGSRIQPIICESVFAEHEKVVLKRRARRQKENTDISIDQYTNSITMASSWNVHTALSNIIIPLLLPYLEVKQRVQCQSISRVWKETIRKWGVASYVDVADPSFPVFNRKFLRGIINHSYSSLHTLVLNNCKEVCDDDLLPALPHFRRLRDLDLSHCTQITNATLLNISQHLYDILEVLYMKGLKRVTDIGLTAICESCLLLRVLELSEVPITDESPIHKLKNLEALYMRDNYLLTNKSIDVITTQCTHLSQLTLWGCTRIKTLHLLTNNLHLLNLWGCHGLNDDVAKNMHSLPSLRSLVLSECHRLTDKFIFELSKAIPYIYHLHLRYLRRITDASVRCISTTMKNIYTLDFTYCTSISPAAFLELVTLKPNLSELRLAYCPLDERTVVRISQEISKEHNFLSVLDLQGIFIHDHAHVLERVGDILHRTGFSACDGYFSRPVQWSREVQERFDCDIICERVGVKLERRTSDTDLIYGIEF